MRNSKRGALSIPTMPTYITPAVRTRSMYGSGPIDFSDIVAVTSNS
jgi:hypothetical protein